MLSLVSCISGYVEDHSASCDMGDQGSKRQTARAVLCVFFFLGYHNYIFQAKDLLMEVWCITFVKAKLSEVSITQLAPGCFLSYWDLQAVLHTCPLDPQILFWLQVYNAHFLTLSF